MLPSNNVTGQLHALVSMSELIHLNLAGNEIQGSLAPLAKLLHLKHVDLRVNKLQGALPLSLIRMQCRGGVLMLHSNIGFVLPNDFHCLRDEGARRSHLPICIPGTPCRPHSFVPSRGG